MRFFNLFSGAFFILFFATQTNSFAQQSSPFDLPSTIPVPEWVKLVDWKHPNIYNIDSLIEVYKNTNKEDKKPSKLSPVDRNDFDEEEFHEDPYANAYIRWRNSIAPFVQADGGVKYDPDYNKNQLLQSIANQHNGNNNTAKRTTTTANWTLLGPTQTYKAPSGNLENHQNNIYCIGVAPSNPNVLYAGSEPGTFYRSSDKGLHWVSVSDSLTSCGSNSIAVDPTNENIVYTYDGSSNALLKTSTGGTTWSVLSGFTGGGGNAIAIHRTTGRIVITGSTSIYYSDNGGTTWTMSTGSTVTGTLYDLIMNPNNNDTVYAFGSTTGNLVVLMRSVNAGASFSVVTGSLSAEDTKGARFGVSPANSSIVYCINIGSSVPPKLFKSTDRGATWSVAVASSTSGLGGSSATTGLGMSNGQGFYDLSMIVNPLNANDVIVGTTTSYKSTDGGANFSPLGGYSGPFGLHPDLQQAIAIGGDAYMATDGGVNYSSDFFTNTSNWSVRNNGLRSSDFWGFGQGWDEDIVVGGRYHNGNTAICEFYGGGKSLSLGGGEDATGHVFHGRSRIAGFRDIGTLVLPTALTSSITYGAPSVPNATWPQDDYYGLFSSKLVVDPRYSHIFYLGKDSILWKSSNSGASYVALHNFGSGHKVWRFEISRINPKVIYVCCSNGIYKTTDAGTTWNLLTLPVAYSYYNTDIAINPLNENEVYYCMANAGTSNKVFKSLNGGTTWTNITGPTLATQHVAYLQFQGGTKSGVYAITNTRPSKVYYRDSTMADWIAFSDGLPAGLEARVGALIFYRDSKIRLCGNSSVWESPLYSTSAPVAQPMADKQYVGCTRDTVNFFDYSMVDYAGATRTWTFPGATWVSSATSRTPKVLYPGPGAYSVTLSVTNATGQVNSHTVDSMIIVTDDHCAPDTVAGKCLQLNRTNQTVNLGIANINSNNFSISCWIQPKGLQSSFAQIVSHDLYPGSAGYGFGFGFIFNGYTPNLRLCYTDSMVNYGNSSSLVCDSTKWNYVVLSYSPNGVVMYLNGIADTVNNYSPMPVIDLSQSPFIINFDDHPGQGSKYDGKIEEVKFYNYALNQNEVREKMHIIPNPATETGLIKYFQFNQYDAASGTLYDVKANFSTQVPSTNIVTSTAPVSTGRVYRNPLVNTAGANGFAAADLNINLPSSGTYPAGEVVAFHLFSNPDTKPDSRPQVPGYFIVNNYGLNQTFSPLDSIKFSQLRITYPGYRAGNFKLFSRSFGDFGNTWSSEIDSAVQFNYTTAGSKLTWSSRSNLTAFNSQYIIMNSDTNKHNIQVPIVNQSRFTISDLYPNPGKEWCRLNIHCPDNLMREAAISITDIKGQEILNMTEKLTREENTLLIHLPVLAEGTYLVTINIPGEPTEVRKLLVD